MDNNPSKLAAGDLPGLPAQPKAWGRALQRLLLQHNALVMLLVLVAVASSLSADFFTWQNLGNLLRQSTPLMLVSIGMLIVILTAGIDLSVASVAAVGGIVVAMSLNLVPLDGGAGLLLAVAIALAAGC